MEGNKKTQSSPKRSLWTCNTYARQRASLRSKVRAPLSCAGAFQLARIVDYQLRPKAMSRYSGLPWVSGYQLELWGK